MSIRLLDTTTTPPASAASATTKSAAPDEADTALNLQTYRGMDNESLSGWDLDFWALHDWYRT